MARKSVFTVTDVKRAVQAIRSLGLPIGGVEIDPHGKIRVFTGAEAAEPESALKDWLAKHAHRT